MIKLTFLGTADQIPSADRNHSAIFLNYNEENLLIDCGEGTQRQFRKARLNPCKVNRILLTHVHGDHVFGLPGLLSTFNYSEYNKTLYIYGPKGTKKFLNLFLGLSDIKRNFEIKVEEVFGKFFETSDFYLEAEKMEHGIPCNAYSFVIKDKLRIDKKKLGSLKLPLGKHLQDLKEGKDIIFEKKKYKSKDLTYLEKGKKISIVLDTAVNPRIVPFVKNSDLLICESSFGEELKDHAKEHLHLTSRQAAEIASRSNSKKLILTHISQRYEKNPKQILDQAKKVFKNSFLVKDLDVFEV